MPPSRVERTGSTAPSLVSGSLIILCILAASATVITVTYRHPEHINNSYLFAVFATISLLALIGIVGLLAFRRHDTKIAREEARRIAIAELLKMAMDDPALDEAWGPVPEGDDRKARRQLMYINMIVSEWQMSYETKALPEVRLRAISREMFSGRPGRAYWQEARRVRLNTSADKRARRFHEILDEEYDRAPVPPPEPRPSRRRPWVFLAATAVGALALTPVLRRALTHRAPRS